MAAHVPFIVPGRQLYLPMLWIDLRESFDAAPQTAGPWLGWSAQLVLLRHLLRGDVEDRPLVGVAGDCGYSAMTLSKARRELIAAGLAVKGAGKRPKPLCFAAPPAELWERALPLLRSPVAKVHPVARLAPGLHPQSAGTTALADQTALAPDPLPTAALSLPAFRRGLTDRTLTLAPGWDEAALRIEAWKYDPQRLSEGGAVDPLSLYLCLRLDPDERVQAALEGLVATVRW
ncbi:MAG: hypothetical protein H8E31_00880 [Planctomycetes bacterium]|nr:hypothetical protein [Planctomycetota bacterium]